MYDSWVKIAASKLLPWVVGAAACALSWSARADIITPDVTACENKEAGTACTVEGEKGACQAQTCSRPNYPIKEGKKLEYTEYDCVLCKPGVEPTKKPQKTGLCSVSPTTFGASPAALALLLLGLMVRRRS